MPTASAPVETAPGYAVALFPGEDGATVREVRVLIVDLFGAPSLADAIGAAVREVDSQGVPISAPWAFLPVQRLIAARVDATGRKTVPARELAEKREAYAARLAAGDTRPAFVSAARRKPRLVPPPPSTPPDVENDVPSCEPTPEELGWLAEHEAQQEAAA